MMPSPREDPSADPVPGCTAPPEPQLRPEVLPYHIYVIMRRGLSRIETAAQTRHTVNMTAIVNNPPLTLY